MSNSIKQVSWLDLLVISIISISIVSISLLVTDVFRPRQALFLGLAVSTLIFFFLKSRVGRIGDADSIGWLLLLIVLCSIIFRLDPYPWINGGQDQGVYVSMSAHYQHGGSVFIEDSTAKRLGEGDLRNVYKSGLRRGEFHPGVYYSGPKDYIFQFYHLHPLWMAIFADLLGDDARVYALTLFGLLSIVFLSLLTLELSKSKAAALSVGLLMAVNPLHAFFSKWPVTEVVALAFSSMAFYYLAVAYRLSEVSLVRSRYALVISCATLSMLFFVRISGFFYLPALVFLFFFGAWIWRIKGRLFGRDLKIFVVICIVAYIISVAYGLRYSPVYSRDIYRTTFGKLAGGDWQLLMSLLLLGMIFAMSIWLMLLSRAPERIRWIDSLQPRAVTFSLISLTIISAGVSIFIVYRMGYTEAYAKHPWWGLRWRLSGAGSQVAAASSVLHWLLYSSPLLILVGLIGLWRNGSDWRLTALIWVPAIYLLAFFIQTPVIPYQYYYARYLLSEGVPYAIVIAVIATVGSDRVRWQQLGVVAVVLSAVWFGVLSARQFGVEEGVRPLKVLRQLAAYVDQEDVLLIEPSGWKVHRFAFETPLRFYFGLNTFAISRDQRRQHDSHISRSFRRTWLLSPKVIEDDDYVFRDRFLHWDKVMERSKFIPMQITENFWRQELFLYELKQERGLSGADAGTRFQFQKYTLDRDKAKLSNLFKSGWYNMEASHVWSSKTSTLMLASNMFALGDLPPAVVLELAPFAATEDRPVSMEVTACGVDQTFVFQSSKATEVRIPIGQGGQVQTCTIRLSLDRATSPAALGRSADARVLGVSLRSVTFE